MAAAQSVLVQVLEVDGRPPAEARRFALGVMDLDASDAGFELFRKDFDVVAGLDLAGEHRPGDNRPESLADEDPVQGHPEISAILPNADARSDRLERGGELL